MPASPTPAQADTSRRNGTLSQGPTTPEGRARSSLNAPRHNLHGPFRLLPAEDAAAFGAFLADLTARHAPADEVEAHWIEELAFAMWRQRRLRALEAAALARAEDGGTNEPDAAAPAAAARSPSLATLTRYRARVERDLRLAEERLATAKRNRTRLSARFSQAGAARLRWLAERMGEGAAADDDGTVRPQTAGTRAPKARPDRAGTKEPEPAARPLNRAERRRRAALARTAGRAAA